MNKKRSNQLLFDSDCEVENESYIADALQDMKSPPPFKQRKFRKSNTTKENHFN